MNCFVTFAATFARRTSTVLQGSSLGRTIDLQTPSLIVVGSIIRCRIINIMIKALNCDPGGQEDSKFTYNNNNNNNNNNNKSLYSKKMPLKPAAIHASKQAINYM